ncbi:hypothetical protein CALVIDRAFT_18410 [Calocera viscosa TUFC12733]|uniref:Trichome birefringence-like C-terminal domain-containing protein n=1 Tax=Calocera viscosa (strain TUFC12733) TaxID=1330018 RepID=A0A167SDR8_CALVF|nr:hypothetical protein CALVIDRAFT_18410 [Calocera viscosa TUFC12733]
MRRVIALTLLGLLLSALYLIRLLFAAPALPVPAHFSPFLPLLPPSQQHTSLLRGKWHPAPLSSAQELEARFGPGGPACFAPLQEEHNLTAEERRAAGEARRLAVSGWEWVPERGRMREWDTLGVLRRLLNSERGLVLVGDSITGQMASALHSLLLIPPSGTTPTALPLLLPSTHRSPPPHNALTRLTLQLNPLHPLHTFLRLSLPHVPPSRFAEPIAQFLRHDLLLPFPALEQLFAASGVHNWVGERAGFFAQHPWLTALPSAAQPGPLWENEQPSLLVLNTGAHWTPDHFYLPGGEYVLAYARMVRSLAPTLLALPRLHVVYRTISPPHTACALSSSPAYPAPPPDTGPAHPEWGWDKFPELDSLWRAELDRLAPHGLGPAGGRVGWLDVGEMARQRPDAHLLGKEGGDCMHWCGPGVPGEWVRLLWVMVDA